MYLYNKNISLLFNNEGIFEKMKEKLDGLENWLAINIQIYENENKINITF